MVEDLKKGKTKRPGGKRLKRKNQSISYLPSGVVLNAVNLADRPGAVELSLVLSFIVIGIYLFGFYESIMSLPDAPKMPNFAAHMGANLNLPHPSEWNSVKQNVENVILTPPRGNLRHLEDHGTKDLSEKVRQHQAKAAGQPYVAEKAAVPVPEEQKDFVPVFKHNEEKEKAQPASSHSEIPAGKWPVSLRDEPDNHETIIHPGDEETEMKVPKFWSAPVHHNGLMSRETAMKIGSCIEPDPVTGSYNRGTDCPLDKRTIYVGIASYRDFECRSTAESIFLRAKNPDRIRIGVVDQIVDGEDPVCNAPLKPCDEDPNQGLCKYKDQIDVYQMEAYLSIGPVFARHIGYRMYRGEYYATQSDAHVTYTQDWDADIISQLEITNNEMAVLSTYLSDIQGSIDKQGRSLRHTRPIMCNTRYEGGAQGMHLRHGSQPERPPSVHGSPQLQPWWAAGYSFSRGHFVVNVPYDWLQPMIFQGEEMSIGIRGYTIGYDYYAPERSVCFHHYAVGKNAKIRNKVHHFWENTNKYAGTGKKAMKRLLGIVRMIPEVDESEWDHAELELYGIGGVRTPEKFYETFGIHVREKKVEGHLCSFVDTGARMHHDFTKHLRSDGMGIDYSNIHYQFTDPRPGQK